MNLQIIQIIKNIKTSLIKNGQNIRLKIIGMKIILIISGVILILNTLKAQEETSVSDNFNFDLDIKNMHLWHGFVVTPGVMMASSVGFVTTNQKFIAGLWGGANYNGTYKEFSYYTKYNFTERFNASLISHNNYSDYEDPNIFSYNKFTSPNFVDVVLEYTLSDEMPFTFYWSTILFGNGGDFETGADGSVANSYSNYAELRYQFFHKMPTRLSFFAGAAFSFFTEKTFYSESANFVNLGLSLIHEVNFFSRKFPVNATAFWNPESKIGALQLAIKLF
jgi:hypothetical protein